MTPISLQPTLPNPETDKATASSPTLPGDNAFSQILDQTVGRVNQMQLEADKAINDLTTGKSSDLHQTMITVEKTSIAFELVMTIRNKILDAYNTIMRMPV